jgi:hypothetical protein
MLDFSDSRFYGIIAILLILIIGYFVYLMYSDLVLLKKQVGEISMDDLNEIEENFGEDDDEAQDDEEDYADGDDEDPLAEWNQFLQAQRNGEYPSDLQKHLHGIMETIPEDDEDHQDDGPRIVEAADPQDAGPAEAELELKMSKPTVIKQRKKKSKKNDAPPSEEIPVEES